MTTERDALTKVRDWLADSQMETWPYMENGPFYEDRAEMLVMLNAALAGRDAAPPREAIAEAVNRFLAWPLPKDFGPDCGISFDGRKPDEWNPNKGWPVGTNLFTADQARAMLEHCLATPPAAQSVHVSAGVPSTPSADAPTREDGLTFAAFRKANVTRCLKWHPAGIESWSPSDWLTAITGELGELASLVKMRNRERDGLPGNKFSPSQKQIADEIADVLTYLDLFAAAVGVDLGPAAVEKFNEVSERVGFPDRLRAGHAARGDEAREPECDCPVRDGVCGFHMPSCATRAAPPEVAAQAGERAFRDLIWRLQKCIDDLGREPTVGWELRMKAVNALSESIAALKGRSK